MTAHQAGPTANPLSRRTLFAAAAAAAGGVVVLAGCSSEPAAPTGNSSGPLTKPSTKPDRLVVRMFADPWERTYADGPAQAFTARTGIPVEFDLTDFNDMQAKIATALQAGSRPPVDVNLTIETSAYLAGVQNLTATLDPNVLTRFEELSSFGRPKEGSAYVNISGYTYPIVYAADRVDFPEGVSINALWDPAYRGRIFVGSTSTESLLGPLAKSLGIDDLSGDLAPVWQRLAELAPNIGGTGDEEEFISGIQRDQLDAGVILAAVARETDGLQWTVPSEGAAMSFESMYVPRGLPSDVTWYAQEFINDVLDAGAQSAFAEALGEVPTQPAATIPAFMKGDPAFPTTEEEVAQFALLVDPDLFARNNSEWSAQYSAAIKG